jgi:hypothetical protein
MKNILNLLSLLILLASCTNAQNAKPLKVKPVVDKKAIYTDSIVNLAKVSYAKYQEMLSTRRVIVIDFTRPMETERLFVVDLDSNKIIKSTKVCHGKGSGMTSVPTDFSNQVDSKKSSLGYMVTAESYRGAYGYSMRVDGLEPSNNNVRKRAIVFHNSEVQSTAWSWGCFSIPEIDCKEVINLTKNGSLMYVFSNTKKQNKE